MNLQSIHISKLIAVISIISQEAVKIAQWVNFGFPVSMEIHSITAFIFKMSNGDGGGRVETDDSLEFTRPARKARSMSVNRFIEKFYLKNI